MVALRSLAVAVALLSASPARADQVGRWRTYIEKASARFGIPVAWIERVMRAESGGQTRMNGRPITSHAGAMGLMQLMPGTWAQMRAQLRLGADPHDPRDNILAGTQYLRLMYDRFGYPGMFAAYNAGPARYADHLATGRRLPGETRSYLATVSGGTAGSRPVAIQPAANPLFFELRSPPAAPVAAPKGSGMFVTLGGWQAPGIERRFAIAVVGARLGKTQHDGRRNAYQGRRPPPILPRSGACCARESSVFSAAKSVPPPPLRGAPASPPQP